VNFARKNDDFSFYGVDGIEDFIYLLLMRTSRCQFILTKKDIHYEKES